MLEGDHAFLRPSDLGETLAALAEHPDVEVRTVVTRGPVTSTLVDLCAGWDLIVLGSRGLGGVQGRILGSVSQRLMRMAPCPVVVATRPR